MHARFEFYVKCVQGLKYKDRQGDDHMTEIARQTLPVSV